MINTLYIILSILLFFTGLIYTQESKFRISVDNMNWELDKKAHLGVSFGLYYMFYTNLSILDTLNTHTSLDAMLLSSLIGLSYEVYQGTRFSDADGFSKQDMAYNLIGVALARFTHEFILHFKDLI